MIKKIDYVEFYVGNALQSALFYQHFWGFTLISYSGLETGNKETVSYVLRQADTTLVVTSAYAPDHSVSRHVRLHGDSVKNIAFSVTDAKVIYEKALEAGAESEKEFEVYKTDDGDFAESAIK